MDDVLKVFVRHEDPVVEAGLVAMLGSQPGIEVAGAQRARSGAAAPGSAGVIVTDYRGALTLLRTPGSSGPRVMVVSHTDREWDVRNAIRAGVYGYVLQRCSIAELVHGVRMLGRGSRYLCAAVAHSMADSLTREPLTSRETDVLRLLAKGACNKTIGRDLGIAVGTVKAHVKAILEKLQATTRTQAAAIATERGLVDDVCVVELPRPLGREAHPLKGASTPCACS